MLYAEEHSMHCYILLKRDQCRTCFTCPFVSICLLAEIFLGQFKLVLPAVYQLLKVNGLQKF